MTSRHVIKTAQLLPPADPLSFAPGRQDFTWKEWAIIQAHRTPFQVQRFLHRLLYNREKNKETLRTFRKVIRHGSAHCLEGALMAATILEHHGYPPLLLDLESKDNLDHVLFLFRENGRWGTVAQSRDVGLHGRKPIFRSLRDLVLSYFDPYIDLTGRIVAYGVANLNELVPHCNWRLSEKNVWVVQEALIRMPHQRIQISDTRYKKELQRYREFKRRHPDRQAPDYRNRHQWM